MRRTGPKVDSSREENERMMPALARHCEHTRRRMDALRAVTHGVASINRS